MGAEPIVSGMAFRSVCRGPTFFYVGGFLAFYDGDPFDVQAVWNGVGMFSRVITFLFLSIISIYSVRNNVPVIPNSFGAASENSSRYW